MKKDLETDSRRGIVWWRDVDVAEWEGGAMQLLGEVKNTRITFGL